MTNILIMLFLLTAPYLIARGITSATGRPTDQIAAASWGAALLFVFTGIGHFVQTASLTLMLPHWVPERVLLIHATGILEFLIAVGLLFRRTRWASGVVAISVLIAFFPANVYAAFQRIPMSGNEWGPVYLLVRAPLQVVIVYWIYTLVVRSTARDTRGLAN